ncbi:hypothetical protein MITS9509_03496 [Synechococcus sp. MIT S9509]|uniref:hypothetical protein n=1 Tax=Synechococcus sp. MIT S9509 TaxID=1801630 RepID=UPI0007BB99D7|nr:hypothetical protein [Synechococcus sp. MIT S9509]KZR86257.1 hypothetical protein MITS9509_03496 [Synechococcus sp. MIT S9509]
MDFAKIAKQREAKAAVVEETAAVESAREKLEASAKTAKRRPKMSAAEIERQEARTSEQAAIEEAEYQRAFEQKMAAQQAAATEQMNMVRAADQQRSKPGPKRRAESKRNSDDWVAFTAFLKPDTRDRLQNIIHMARSAGAADPADQSEALEAALKPYLQKMEKSLKTKLAKQLGL